MSSLCLTVILRFIIYSRHLGIGAQKNDWDHPANFGVLWWRLDWRFHDGLRLLCSLKYYFPPRPIHLNEKSTFFPKNIHLRWTMQLFWVLVIDNLLHHYQHKHSRKKKHFSKQVPQREEKRVTNHRVTLNCNQTFIHILQNGSYVAGMKGFCRMISFCKALDD